MESRKKLLQYKQTCWCLGLGLSGYLGTARKLVPSIKCLSCKHQELSSDPSACIQPEATACIRNSSSLVDRDKWIPGAHYPTSLAESVNSRFRERRCQKKKKKRMRKPLEGNFWCLHAHVHTHTNMYTHILHPPQKITVKNKYLIFLNFPVSGILLYLHQRTMTASSLGLFQPLTGK